MTPAPRRRPPHSRPARAVKPTPRQGHVPTPRHADDSHEFASNYTTSLPASPPAIHDVAAAAGVSIATVSRFLNRPELVARSTASKVRQAIEHLGYRPNPFAQGLMTRRSQIVGILLPDIHGEFYSELLRGADQEAHRRGYHLLISSETRVATPITSPLAATGIAPAAATPTQLSGAKTKAPISSTAGAADLTPVFGLIDGLAVMITEPNQALTQRVRRSGVPLIMLDAEPRDVSNDNAGEVEGVGGSVNGGVGDVDSIVVDNAPGAEEATRHLLEQPPPIPPARAYFVGGPKDNFDTRQRADAFARVLREHGEPNPERRIYFGDYSSRWGHEWAQNIAARLGKGPIAVLAGNDEIAYGVMRAFQDRGLTVPRDCRIVGFDDTRLATLLRPTLSSVRVPMAALGAAAISTLIDRIESNSLGQTNNSRGTAKSPPTSTSIAKAPVPSSPSPGAPPYQPIRLRLPTQLIIRESSRAN